LGIKPLGTNQIWNIKEFFNLIGLVGIFLLVVPMAQALLSTNFFAGLKKAVPEELPALDTAFRKNLFWGGWILGSIISAVSAALMTKVYNNLVPPNMPTHIFGQNVTNFIVLWAVCNGIWGLSWFFLISSSRSPRYSCQGISPGISLKRLVLFGFLPCLIGRISSFAAKVSNSQTAQGIKAEIPQYRGLTPAPYIA
jgi:hypothetical protein